MKPGKLWFKQKTYGWGWSPANWMGWAVILVFVAAVSAYPAYCETTGTTFKLSLFIPLTLVWTSGLLAACIAKGEKPGWRWGQK